ncbi:hypothetical protein Ddye_026601 [Dipteronia dyeriana]|uniref:Uncharacterized protein n=1 Tax=Dipteronia dyeriana TaxID=168575 RepID=A0AAD9WPP6_9ROSI|nr:hypothetical protein Ddye_026601 [Dipteronia dyeriana]
MRFLLGNHVVRFSKVEFSLITRLHFGVVPDTSIYVAVENDIHQRYFPGHDEVSLDDLRVVLTCREFQQAYDCEVVPHLHVELDIDEGGREIEDSSFTVLVGREPQCLRCVPVGCPRL